MNRPAILPSARSTETAVERYYRLHARIYDLTRWTFLFGRSAILRRALGSPPPQRVLEVGCGTGRNLVELGRLLPPAQLTGLDLSEAMLARARRRTAPLGERVTLVRHRYDAPVAPKSGYDLVLFSYALTMFNPGFEAAIEAAARDLAPGGRIAVVDFHDTRWRWFSRWMGVNHVRMDAQLRPLLRRRFTPVVDEVQAAYGGAWQYLLFVGRA